MKRFGFLIVCTLNAQTFGQVTTARFPLEPVGYATNGYRDLSPFLTLYEENQKYHLGEDWNANDEKDYGDPVYAIGAGTVWSIRNITNKDSWGKVVTLKHVLLSGESVYSVYAHLSKITVALNTSVKKGAKIGEVGDANGKYSPHLHFEMHNDSGVTNPPPNPYVSALTSTAFLSGYINPTLFIHDRQKVLTFFTSTDGYIYFRVAKQAPVSGAYVEFVGDVYSLAEAEIWGMLSKTYQYRTIGTTKWSSISLYDTEFTFRPGLEYRVKKVMTESCKLKVVVPGHSIQDIDARASQDMIRWSAENSTAKIGLQYTRLDVIMEDFEYRSTFLENRTVVYHSTNRKLPLQRFIRFQDPITRELSDWILLDPNKLQ